MKRVKFLLTAITILTVVGGALAFKAAKFTKNYCTKDASGTCTSYLLNSQQVLQNGSLIWAIETNDTSNCTKTTAPACNTQLRLEVD